MNVNNIIKEAGEDPLVKEGLRELHDYDILPYVFTNRRDNLL